MIEKLIREWLKSKPQQTIWIITTFLIASCRLHPQTIDQFFQTNAQLTVQLLGKVSITLFLISFASLASFLILLKKPNLKHYEQINPPGFYKHKKNGSYYCQRCLLKDKIEVPLSPLSKEEYLCRVCKESYKVDYQVLLCDSYMSIAFKESKVFEDHNKAVHEFYLKDDDKTS